MKIFGHYSNLSGLGVVRKQTPARWVRFCIEAAATLRDDRAWPLLGVECESRLFDGPGRAARAR